MQVTWSSPAGPVTMEISPEELLLILQKVPTLPLKTLLELIKSLGRSSPNVLH